jgi:hypothetical protein
LNEIKDRKLNIEVIEEETSEKRGNTNASKIENKGKATE